MKKLFLLLSFNKNKSTIRVILLGLLMSCMSYAGFANVAITAATGGTNICANLACGGGAPAYTTLGNITIREGAGDCTDIPHSCGGFFTHCTVTLVLNAPTGWQFGTVLPTVTFNGSSCGFGNGTDIVSVTPSYGSATACGGYTQLTLTIVDRYGIYRDRIIISGLQVKATSTGSAAGHIYASAGSGIAGITAGSSTTGTGFGNLSLVGGATPTVSITPTPTYTTCPGATVTFSATATGAITAYEWYVNGVATYAGNPFITSTLTSGNTVYCVVTASTCGGGTTTATSTTTTVTVTGSGLITGNPLICIGTPNNLTDATPGGVWSSVAGSGVATVGSTGITTGVSPGTATISYYPGGSCAATFIVTVSAPPAIPTVTPSTASICNGGNVTLTAAGTYYLPTILSQDFNSGLGTWVVDTTGSSTGIYLGSQWKVDGDGYINELGIYHSPDNSAFVMVNGDTSGVGSTTSSQLISPSFSLVGYTTATLTFQQFYNFDANDVTAEIDISTDGGVTWSTLVDYWGTTVGSYTAFATQTVDLTPYIGMSNVMIEYSYSSNYGLSWAIDNINITGTSILNGPIWSPTTYLFSDAGFTTAYASTAADPVYVHPTTVVATTVVTYTATVTDPTTTCSSIGTSVVTINPTPAAITGTMNVCVGLTTALTDATAGGTWSSTALPIGTVNTSGSVTGISSGTTTISYTTGGGCAATAIVTVAAVPGSIAGTLSVCNGSSSALTDAVAGGTWSSSNTAVGTIGSTTGIVTGTSIGTTVITYATSPVCYITATVTVTAPPNNIIGTSTPFCAGPPSVTFVDLTAGGTWSTSNSAVATISGSTGSSTTVTGVNPGGTATITYALSPTCYVTKNVTVNAVPNPTITGPTIVCTGFNINLSNSVGGGTWSSSNTAVGTVGSLTGVVTGLTLGTTMISYSTGCNPPATLIVTVTAAPTPIGGSTFEVCVGSTITLTDGTSPGTWSSSNSAIGPIGSASGVVTGSTSGTTTITYTTICGFVTQVVTVNGQPGPINGTLSFCNLSTSSLSDAVGGGNWTSVNTAVATVDAFGNVTGVSAGTSMISYTIGNCYATAIVTINIQPAAITGVTSVCNLSTTPLTDGTPGGTWTSVTPAVGTVSTTGNVTGISVGTTVISYTIGSCPSTVTVSVTPQPGTINGTLSFCNLSTSSLSDAIGGGTWTSVNTAVATISTSGTVTGISVGTSMISYVIGSCYQTTIVTVNPQPTSITGVTSFCNLSTSPLTDAILPGTWTSVNTSVATVDGSGNVTGVLPGTSTISYTVGSCYASTIVTVNTQPGPINGTLSFCNSFTTQLSDGTPLGTWTSVNTAVATISGTGLVTGHTVGTSMISYTIGSCYATAIVTVNAQPGTINGALSFCNSSITSLTDAVGPGTWTSVNTAVGTIDVSGNLTGLSVGTTMISYTIGSCYATAIATVNTQPGAINGTLSFCNSSTTQLSDGTPLGTWTSVNTAVATISGTGLVTGHTVGTSLISYTIGTCTSTAVVTVNTQPAAITGILSVCNTFSTSLSDVTPLGTWTSVNTAVGTVDGLGNVTGQSQGTTTISYTIGSCASSVIVTVNTQPGPITGVTTFCDLSTTQLTDGTAGGIWTSVNTVVGTVGSTTGLVAGLSVGTSLISYTIGTCTSTTVINVTTQPVNITGPTSVCNLLTISLTDATAGGAWTSSNTGVGTVDGAGHVTGVSVGTTTISYTIGICSSTLVVTVNTQPAGIVGLASICNLGTTSLTDGTPGGAWTSSNTGVGTVDGFGNVTGISLGTTIVSYTIGSCASTLLVTVTTQPGPITGTLSVCDLSSTLLSDAPTGGTWTSVNTAVGTINSTGLLSALSVGTTMISYTIGSCYSTAIVTVNIQPVAITGVNAVCDLLTTSLTDATPGGTWTSVNTGVGTVDGLGNVTGLFAGTTTISYTIGSCPATIVVTVNPLPAPITGIMTVCVGLTTSLTDATLGGTWSSNATGIETINTAGIATGVSAGTAIDTYTLPTGCIATTTVTVNPLPGPITGSTTVCVGSCIALTDAGGGTWSSASGIVSVGSASGNVCGLLSGTATIIYTLPTSCIASIVVTVNPLPSTISGTLTVCVGSVTSLTDAGGGTFSSTSPNIFVSPSGNVIGVNAGTAIVTYTLPTTCFTTVIVTVNPLPSVITPVTTMSVCSGLTIALTDASAGGTWSSSPAASGTISSSGIFTGGTAGTATVTYTLPTGCLTTSVVTINPLPTPILGSSAVCLGFSIALSDLSGGGTWTSSNTAVGSIGSLSGVLTGLTTGTTTVIYILPTSCQITTVVTVTPLPGTISGALTVCPGLTTTLSDTPAGGAWSSSSAGLGSISVTSPGGVVTGISAGTSIVTYTIGTGCYNTAIVTINPLPSAIAAVTTSNVCIGLTISLTDATAGGTWSNSPTAIGTIGSLTGVFAGISAGTTTVTYTISSTGCYMTTPVTVNPLPLPISGTLTVCSGSTTSLSDINPGGTWSSSAPGIASVASTGVVTGTGASGSATITYTLPTTCIITANVTVNPLPAVITGTLTVCPGLTTALSDATTPGIWSSSNTAIGTINSSTGIAGGISPGTVLISYTLPTGCLTTALLTVNPLPPAILGSTPVCQGLSITMSDAATGGTWASSNIGIASVSGSVIVTGVSAGTANITYTLPTTCITTTVVTVNPLPATISGTTNVCVSNTITLSDATSGGTWSGSGSATVGGPTGYVTGISPGGTATITYTLPTGCLTTKIITVNTLPASITGTLTVCVGLTTALSDITTPGTWSSSNLNASVGSTGIVQGLNGGVSIITYTIPTGCISIAVVTVNPLPATIMGNTSVCLGLTTSLTDASPGGAWNSSNNFYASVNAFTGIVSGNNVGTATITYKLPTGCIMTTTVTVDPLPAPITGTMNVCVNYTTTLSDASGGGTWSSSNSAIGSVNSSTGVVGGISAGTVTITYTLPTSCIITTVVTVNPQPQPITGIQSVCHGDTTYLNDVTPGGVWSSSSPATASVGTSGMVIGVGLSGTSTIVYSLAAGCNSTVVVTVNPLPSVYGVTGGGSYCQGGSGVPIGLNGSNVGISYLLYYGPSATGYLAGTGSSLNFGLLTVAGTYTVRATDNTTGCHSNMTGTAVVVITPTVNPLVSITTGVGDTVCPGTLVTFSPDTANAGSAPTYQWSVNGVLVSLSSTYSYIPANGDIVTVIMTSNGVCVMPLTATNYIKMHVIPDANPLVSISIDPGDTICQYAAATFTATPTFGGSAPTYAWYVNSSGPLGSGPIFSYYPTTGDIVYCTMTSNYQCRLSDSANSNVATMTVSPMIIPHVSIVSLQGFDIVASAYDTLHAIATNAGPNPSYQWVVNGVPVTGATSATFISQFNNYDSISCVVTSSGVCEGISTFDWVYITVHPVSVQQYISGNSDVRLIPNPNTGVFTIRGTIGTLADEEVYIDITDIVGQVVYKNTVMAHGGKINEQIKLNSTLSNGMYLLNLRSGDENKVFHFVIEQ